MYRMVKKKKKQNRWQRQQIIDWEYTYKTPNHFFAFNTGGSISERVRDRVCQIRRRAVVEPIRLAVAPNQTDYTYGHGGSFGQRIRQGMLNLVLNNLELDELPPAA